MKEKEISIEKIGLKAGLITSISLVIYFFIIRFFNLLSSEIAWGVNLIILSIAINLSYRYYRILTKPNIEYLPGMLLGGIITSVSTIIFTLFIYLYFESEAKFQLQLLNENLLFMGGNVTPLKAAGATLIEGLTSGVIVSFILMQYYKSGFKKSQSDTVIQG